MWRWNKLKSCRWSNVSTPGTTVDRIMNFVINLGLGQNLKNKRIDFELYSLSYRQPMKMVTHEISYIVKSWSTWHDSRCGVDPWSDHSSVRPSVHLSDHSPHSFIHSFIHSFVHSFVCLLTRSFINTFIYQFIHPIIHQIIHPFTHPFIHPLIN